MSEQQLKNFRFSNKRKNNYHKMHRPGAFNHMNSIHRTNQLQNIQRINTVNFQQSMQRNNQLQSHLSNQRSLENQRIQRQQFHRQMEENNRRLQENTRHFSDSMRRVAEDRKRMNEQNSMFTPLLSNDSYDLHSEQLALSQNFRGNYVIEDTYKTFTAKVLVLIAILTIPLLPLSIVLLVWSFLLKCEYIVLNDLQQMIIIGEKRCLTGNFISIKRMIPFDKVDHFENSMFIENLDTELVIFTKDGKKICMCSAASDIQEKRLNEVREWWNSKAQPQWYTPPTVPPLSA
jgi:hypothetical protein